MPWTMRLCSAASRAQCTWIAVALRIGFELLEIVVEVRERVLLDGGGQRAQLLPFGDAMHLPIALLAQIPEPLIVHRFMRRCGNEARRGFGLVHRPIAATLCAARLKLSAGGRSGFEAASA